MRFTLLGVDPGVADTGLVAITLDYTHRQWDVQYKVWSNVIERDGFSVSVKHYYLDDLVDVRNRLEDLGPVFSGVEGYRPRGKNKRQDEEMSQLVQTSKSYIKNAKIIDNTGIKKVVTEPALRLFKCSRFEQGTNHADLKSAARVALKRGIDEDTLNEMLAEFYMDNLLEGGKRWELGSIRTL